MDFRENSNRNVGTYSDHVALFYAMICCETRPYACLSQSGRQDS